MESDGVNSHSDDLGVTGRTHNKASLHCFRETTLDDVAWDTWEQRHDIKHNTLHPRHAADLLDIKVQSQLLCLEGRMAFFHKTACSSRNWKQHCSKGEPSETAQWIASVLNTTRWAAQAKNDLNAAMNKERGLMKFWLTPV
jgi:hypothetical protein